MFAALTGLLNGREGAILEVQKFWYRCCDPSRHFRPNGYAEPVRRVTDGLKGRIRVFTRCLYSFSSVTSSTCPRMYEISSKSRDDISTAWRVRPGCSCA